MANGRSIKTDGWKDLGSPEVEARAPASVTVTSIEPISSAVAVPSDISWHELMAAHADVLGEPKWRAVNEGHVDLSEEERRALLGAVLGDLPLTVENVSALREALRTKNTQGWNWTDFPVYRVAADYLGSAKALKAEEGTFRNGLLAELAERCR